MDLGSARGQIILDSSGVTKGVRAAVSALRDFEGQTSGAGKNLAQIERAGAQMGNGVAKGAQEASRAVRELASSTQDVSGAFDKLAGNAAVLGGGLAAGLGVAVKSAADLQTELAAVSTLKPNLNLTQVGDQIEEMSIRVGKSQTDLAATLYGIFGSVEASQSEALALTEQFSKQATANRTDVESFGTSVLGVLNAMNLGLDQSAHVGDVFTKTIQDGVISGTQLASVLGNVSQSANAAGVNIDELGALIAGVTKAGGDASQRVNDLNNLLQKLVTTDVQKGMADLGVATKNADGSFRDVLAVLRDLDTALGKLSQSQRAETLQKLFPDAQARTGLTAVLGQLESITQAAQENAAAVGVADRAYSTMAGTAAQSAARLKATLFATLIDAGNIALPNLVGLAEHVRDLVGAFSELSPGTQSAIVNGTALAAAFLLIGSTVSKAVTMVIEIGGAIKAASLAAASGAKALAAYATSAEAASLATVALPPALIAVGLAAAGTALTMNDMATGTRKAADAIGGDLADALKKIDTSKMEGVKDFLLGINSEAEKAGDATHAWAADKSIDQLREKLLQVVAEYDKLSKAGGVNSSEAATLREVSSALSEELALRERITEQTKLQVAAQTRREAELSPPDGAALTDAEQAALRLGVAMGALAPTFAQTNALIQQMGGAAGNTSTEVDTLSASYFANANAAREQAAALAIAASQAEIFKGLNDRLAGLQQQAQGVTSSVQPMQAALDLLNQKVAAGIPLTNEQAHLLSTLPGYIAAATSGYDGLITNTAQAAIAIQNANKAATGGGASFPTLAGQASALQGALDALRTSAIQLEGALGALGSENSKLGAEYNILNERVQALNDKKKETGKLSADETAELATLQNALNTLGGTMGENAAKQRELILQLLGVENQTKTTSGALATVTNALGQVATPMGQASNALIGLDDGFGHIATAAGAAVTPVSLVSEAVKNLPTSKTVTVDFKVTGIGTAGEAASGLKGLTEFGPGEGPGGGKTITVTADTSAADTKLAAIKQTLSDVNSTTADPKITATDNASPAAQAATTSINSIPPSHDTVLTVTDNASGVVLGLIDIINSVPSTLNVTAHVDTSGALAAIADLRAYMPASPAEKGPFSTLPDWNSVFASLEPAGDAAVETTQTTVQRLAAAITTGMTDAEAGAAKGAAELASSLASAVSAALEALSRLRTFRPPDPRKFEALRAALLPIASAFAADAAAAGEAGLEGAGKWADGVGKILATVGAGVDALEKLRDFQRPADNALTAFRDASRELADLLLQVARDTDAGMVEAGAQWAEGAGAIFQAVGSGVDALLKLRDFRLPSDRAATDFRDISQFVVNLLAQVAADIEDEALPKAKEWADTASAIFGALSSGVDALTKLHEFERPTDQAVASFRDVAQYTVNLLAQVAADIEGQALPKAEAWANTATAIFGALSSGVEAFGKLGDFERPTDAALASFRDAAQQAVNLIAEVAATTDATMVADAATYADAAGRVLSLIGSGVQTLGKLGEGEFRPPDRATLDQIAEGTRQAVLAIAQAARLVETDLVDDAAAYSDGAGKAVGLIGAGFAAFQDIGTFVPPSEAQIRNLVNVTAETVRRIAEAAKTMDQEAVKAAGEFGENGGKAIGVVGATLSAFGNMKDFVAPSKEGIDEVVAVVDYTAHRLAGIAQGFDPNLLTRLGQFGDGVGSGLSAVRAALDLGKTFADEDRVKPADALGTALAEFQAGLVPLDQLVLLSEEYKLKGAAIGTNFAQAYADIAASLPGFFPEQAAATASVTVGAGQQTVVHRFEGAIQFQLMDENGAWVVRSMEIDNGSRAELANLIAGELLPLFGDAAQA